MGPRAARWVLLAVTATCLRAFLGGADARAAELAMAPVSALSEEVRQAPEPVREAYRFALANPALLQKIPCYCACETWKHESNYDCYVESAGPGDRVVLSDHGLA